MHMLERGYIARQIRDIDAYVPEIARMLCSGDKEQIYKAKKLGDKFFTVIVEPHQLRNHWKWTIEIITRSYAGEEEVIKHFQNAIEASEHAYQRGGVDESYAKPRKIELYGSSQRYHEYQQYSLEFVVTAPKELR